GGGRGGGDERHFAFANVSVDRQGLVGRQRTDRDRHVVTFDQLLCLGLRQGRVAGRILGDEVDLAPGDGAVALFQEQGGAFLLLLAASGKRTGFDREESDAKRLRRLSEQLPRRKHADGRSAGEQRAAGYRKFAVST